MLEETTMKTDLSVHACIVALAAFVLAGCAASNIEPVEIYPEDNCSQCRMAISDVRFAGEILDAHGDVYKFDDLGCMFKFRAKHADLKINAMYVKDYDTKEWIPYERAVIVATSLETPMGSGKVAFADPERAKAAQQRYPVSLSAEDCAASSCD
jgi:copper chaperone NosL